MRTRLKLPEHVAVNYAMTLPTGYYTKMKNQPDKTAVIGLPNELDVVSIPQGKSEREPIILIVDVDGNHKDTIAFFIRLHKTAFHNWYVGNTCEKVQRKKIKRVTLFHFSENENTLWVYYFSHYDKKNKEERLLFAMDAIPLLLKQVSIKGRCIPLYVFN